jgi:PAS domain-containing protein
MRISNQRSAARPPGLRPPVVVARGGKSGVTYRSTQAHLQYWIGSDIAVEISAERLLAAYSAWTTLAASGLPSLHDLLQSEARQADADLLLYLRVDDDYLVIAQGPDRTRHIGRDLRGRLMSEMSISVGHMLKELYDACFAHQTAISARFVSELASDSIYWEGLFLPIKGGDRDQTRFLASYAAPIDTKTDVLQMILDRSPTGMIVAVPIGAQRGGVQDGRIILVNARAKTILKFDQKGSDLIYVRDLVPWLHNVVGWTRVSLTVENQQTRVHYRDRSGRSYLVTMESLRRFILFGVVEYDQSVASSPGDAGHSSGASTIGS